MYLLNRDDLRDMGNCKDRFTFHYVSIKSPGSIVNSTVEP